MVRWRYEALGLSETAFRCNGSFSISRFAGLAHMLERFVVDFSAAFFSRSLVFSPSFSFYDSADHKNPGSVASKAATRI
jgi:hypothetical protein